MTLLGIAIALYMVIAAFSIYMTYQERRQTGEAGLFLTVCSYTLCILWPLTVVAALLSPASRTA
ncbi:MAG: hypothetical protein ACK4MS_08570 [Paracoccaceae bacterium]